MLGHNNIFKWENNGGESNLIGHRESKRIEIAHTTKYIYNPILIGFHSKDIPSN